MSLVDSNESVEKSSATLIGGASRPINETTADPSQLLLDELRDINAACNEIIAKIVSDVRPQIRGSRFGVRSEKCGKPNCRCARGESHVSKKKFLSTSVEGRTRWIPIPQEQEAEITSSFNAYREWQKNRAQLVKLNSRILKVIDSLAAQRLLSYPENEPIPPLKRRGRKPHK